MNSVGIFAHLNHYDEERWNGKKASKKYELSQTISLKKNKIKEETEWTDQPFLGNCFQFCFVLFIIELRQKKKKWKKEEEEAMVKSSQPRLSIENNGQMRTICLRPIFECGIREFLKFKSAHIHSQGSDSSNTKSWNISFLFLPKCYKKLKWVGNSYLYLNFCRADKRWQRKPYSKYTKGAVFYRFLLKQFFLCITCKDWTPSSPIRQYLRWSNWSVLSF